MTCGEKLAQALREHGFRVTAQRTIILETIAHMEGHISAQQVYEQAQARLPGLNLATVYRTVETLHQAGLIDLLSTSTNPMRFSLHDPKHPHGHLICRECGCTEELPFDVIQDVESSIRTQLDFWIDRDHLSLTGLCRSCMEAGEDHSSQVGLRNAPLN